MSGASLLPSQEPTFPLSVIAESRLFWPRSSWFSIPLNTESSIASFAADAAFALDGGQNLQSG
jgi:hypothetical protein